MNQLLAIAVGGALGSVARYVLSNGVYALFGRGFPYGTLAVNVLGCLAMGFLFMVFLERFTTDGVLRAGVLVGVLGGFTTFSSFSIETFNLIENGELVKAGLNMALSLILCIAATWVGAIIGRQL